jgi:hypothetical protein
VNSSEWDAFLRKVKLTPSLSSAGVSAIDLAKVVVEPEYVVGDHQMKSLAGRNHNGRKLLVLLHATSNPNEWEIGHAEYVSGLSGAGIFLSSAEHSSYSLVTKPSPVARRITDRMARLLPVAHRTRYAAEFRSELHEMTANGASRWQQWMYALRLFDMVFNLRAELRPAKRQVG